MKHNDFILFINSLLLLLIFSGNIYSYQITWSKTYGDPDGANEQGVDIIQTFDDGYIVLCKKSYDNSYMRIQLLKLDEFGNLQWQRVLTDSAIGNNPYSIQQTNDSGFIIAGTSENAFLLKADKKGYQEWKRYYEIPYSNTSSNFVTVTDDNGYIFCGSATFSNPYSDKGYIVKANYSGFVQWQKFYTDSISTSFSEVISNAGYYYVTGGTSNINPIIHNTVIKKLNAFGEIVWSRVYARNASGANIIMLDDTSLIINARIQNLFSPRILRMNTSGELIWDVSFLSPSFSDYHSSICKDENNNIQKVGDMNDRIAYTEISSFGSQITLNPYTSTGLLGSYGNVIKYCRDGGFIIVGTASAGTQSNQIYDVLVIKTDSAGNAPVIVGTANKNSSVISNYQLSQNFPNPFNPYTYIKFRIPQQDFVRIKIYNSIGQEVASLINKELLPGEYSIKFDAHNLSSGVYYYRMLTENYSQTEKMLLLK